MPTFGNRVIPRPFAPIVTGLVLILVWGCGDGLDRPETVPVQGTVYYQGEPVAQGNVSFQSSEGHVATGAIQSDGSYRLSTFRENDGAVLGNHRVGIVASDADPTMIPGSTPGYEAPTLYVPEHYNNPSTSGLTADVDKDTGDIDFHLD